MPLEFVQLLKNGSRSIIFEEKIGTRPTELNIPEADAINLIKIERMTPSDFVGIMQSFKRHLNYINAK